MGWTYIVSKYIVSSPKFTQKGKCPSVVSMLFLLFVFLVNSTLQIHSDGVLAHYTLDISETRNVYKGTGFGGNCQL